MTEQVTNETDAETESTRDRSDQSHLEGVDDGCGCAEVWEHLSENRDD